MTANKISLRELSSMMYQVFNSVSLDMAYYQAMFNGLITDMNFRFKDLKSLRGDIGAYAIEKFEESPEETFYDAINGYASEGAFYNIVKEFIEPLQVDSRYVTALPKSLTA